MKKVFSGIWFFIARITLPLVIVFAVVNGARPEGEGFAVLAAPAFLLICGYLYVFDVEFWRGLARSGSCLIKGMTNFLSRFVLFTVTFSSVSLSEDITPYTLTSDSIPKINVISEAFLGDSILTLRNGEWRECITPKSTYTGNYSGSRVRYLSGVKMCKGNLSDKFYHPPYTNYTFGNDSLPVRWKSKGDKSSLCACYNGCGWCVKKLPENAVKQSLDYLPSNEIPSKSIEIIGIDKKILKFAYTERTRDDTNVVYREFNLDLQEGNLAAYKGAIIEIISSTNMSIAYKVKRNFKN